MEMKKVLKVILIRSGILLSLLVVLIMAIKTMMEKSPPSEPKKAKMLAVLIKDETQEREMHIRGIRDGLIFNGLQYEVKIYALTSLIREASLVYMADPRYVEEIIRTNGNNFNYPVIGYSYIREPKEGYTGIYCGLDWQTILPVYKKIFPQMKRLGVIYTQDSYDGERQAYEIKSVIEMRPQMSVIIRTIDHYGEDIEKTVSDMIPNVDVIYAVSRDRIIQLHLEGIAQFCLKNRIPLIGGGIFGPQKGAVASIDHDPYRVGRKIAEIIRAFEQQSPMSKMGIVNIDAEIYLNLTSAYFLGVYIPADIRKNAKKVYN